MIARTLLNGADALARAPGWFWNADLRVYRQVLDLSDTGVAKVDGDFNVLFHKPRGTIVGKIEVVSSVSLTTSQLSFGTEAAPAKYGALKAYGTTPNAIIAWAVATTFDDDLATAAEIIGMTVDTANLPGAGIVIADMHVLSPG
jgi:hypothetical protein